MLIIEGPDGAGKSTLVRQLQEEYNFQLGERAVSDRSRLYEVTRQDTYTALARAVKGNQPPLIWDRLFYSEMVYAPVVDRVCEFSAGERLYVQAVLAALDCPVIVCLPPFHVVRNNALAAEQMKGVNENIRAIYNAYEQDHLGWPAKTMWYDYTGEMLNVPGCLHAYYTYTELKVVINQYLAAREEREWEAAVHA